MNEPTLKPIIKKLFEDSLIWYNEDGDLELSEAFQNLIYDVNEEIEVYEKSNSTEICCVVADPRDGTICPPDLDCSKCKNRRKPEKNSFINSPKMKKIINQIIEKTKISKEEIQERVKGYINELDGMISEEGALSLLVKDLGIDIEEKKES